MAGSDICEIVDHIAAADQLPVGYLSRLLWTESRFSNAATSPAGAEGIAQFMPGTAAEQGLRNPRDPASSIAHAAGLLVKLHRRFGNLGLAAAAYNAGPGRLSNWLQGSGVLPAQTRRYVRLVTGRPLGQWIEIRQVPVWGGTNRSCRSAIAEFQRNGDGLGMATETRRLYPLSVLADGNVVSRNTGQPLTISDRLVMHHVLSRAVGLSLGR